MPARRQKKENAGVFDEVQSAILRGSSRGAGSGFPAFRRRNTVRMQNLRRVRRESGRVRERK